MKKMKPSWWDEFMAFAVKGNAMALAVGTIIGAAFSTITKSRDPDSLHERLQGSILRLQRP